MTVEQEQQARAMVRRVYSTPEGKKVLSGLLLDLGLFGQGTDAESVALRNFAVFYIKERLGFRNAEDMNQLTELILSLGK